MKNGFIILSVSQLNTYVRSLLEGDKNLSGLFLRGEISNFTNHYRSGHFYMSLKDENAVIRAVMFKGNTQRLRFMPQDGMKVIVTGRASLYDRDGQFQFYIDDMQPDGVGALYIALEQIKEKLRLEGLFDEALKKPLPPFPERIGIVTSPTGAALQDMLNILRRRWPVAQVIFYPVLVQGEGASAQIAEGIRQLNQKNACDVIIIGRGGGSFEDLWAFNDEKLTRTIAQSDIPIVSAVGHETDYTLTDLAADLRAPTPSAAAEMVSPDIQMLGIHLQNLKAELAGAMKNRLSDLRARYEQAADSRALKSPMNLIELKRLRLDNLVGRAANAQNSYVSTVKTHFCTLAGRLDTLSPLKVLSRGYAIPSRGDGSVVRSAVDLAQGDEINLRLSGGNAGCRILSIKTDE